MRIGWDERTLFHSYIVTVVVLFSLYIIPVILLDFLGLDIKVTGALGDLSSAVFHYFFLIGVPLLSVLLGAMSMSVLGWRAAPEGPKELPHYIGYMMLFVTMLSVIIWIVDMSVY